MIIPNFFIVGAPKCATTALSVYLGEHPDIFVPPIKEPHYFAHDFPHTRQDCPTFEKYTELFDLRNPGQHVVGEASVWYLYSQVAATAIREFNEEAKIIVMIRNPAELVPSLHSQLLFTRDEDVLDVRTAWRLQWQRAEGKAVPKRCRQPAFLQYGAVAKLGDQIERLLTVFPRENVKIINFSDLVADARTTYLDVLRFLGAPDDQREEFPRINTNRHHKSLRFGNILMRQPPSVVRLVKRTKRALGYSEFKRIGLTNFVLRYAAKHTPREPVDEAFKAELADFFREDAEKLERITGIPVTQRWYGQTAPKQVSTSA